jgi:acetyltransferase-like isoleucine patch superfamily enzyme
MMPETDQEQFQRIRGRVFWEIFWRSLRLFLPCRLLINTWLILKTRSAIHPLARIDWNVRIGPHCFIGNSLLSTLGGLGSIDIGEGTIVSSGCEIICHYDSHIRIGSKVLFTHQAAALTGGHGYSNRETPIISQPTTHADVLVEDNCWIGYRAILCPGAIVRQGSIIAAGGVVTKEIPPMVIAGGVPAKVIRER